MLGVGTCSKMQEISLVFLSEDKTSCFAFDYHYFRHSGIPFISLNRLGIRNKITFEVSVHKYKGNAFDHVLS
jgi:hypothetical protein